MITLDELKRLSGQISVDVTILEKDFTEAILEGEDLLTVRADLARTLRGILLCP